ncbi:hypothetical protein [Brasilonema sennae]|nr:hypothetical protein [Brasilonema sennae]
MANATPYGYRVLPSGSQSPTEGDPPAALSHQMPRSGNPHQALVHHNL